MSRSSSSLESTIWWLVFMYFVLPGLCLGVAAVLLMLNTGWTLLGLPSWALVFYAASLWGTVCGLHCLRQGARLPNGMRLRKAHKSLSALLLVPIALPIAFVILVAAFVPMHGQLDGAGLLDLRELVPAMGWLSFVVMPLLVDLAVLVQLASHMKPGDSDPGAGQPAGASLKGAQTEQSPGFEEDWEQRFARQRAQRATQNRERA